MSQLSDTLNLIEYYKRTRGPKRMLRIDNNTYNGGNLGGITVTKKRKKPYFVASRTGLLNASDAAKAQDAMFPYISNLVPNVFRGIDNILKGNYFGAGLEAAKAVGARYIPEILNGTIATGDALATTAAGQRLTSGLNFATNAVRSSKAWPWIDAGLSSLFAARGADKIRRGDIHNEGDVVETGLDLLPLSQLARPVINTADRIGSTVENGIDKAVTAWKYRGINAENTPLGLLSNVNPLIARGGYEVARYPGYLLKGLMGGSPLERQLSKNGTININQLNAYFNKASQLEREVANKVLTEKFAGQKAIDYNLFKKAILDELITYNTKPLGQYATYGMDRLGFDMNPPTINDIKTRFPGRFKLAIRLGKNYILDKEDGTLYSPRDFVNKFKGIDTRPSTHTFTFESPRLPVGSNKHYDSTTLGHSRTYTTSEEPNILHVMESQSDWGQSHVKMMPSVLAHQIAIEKALKSGNVNAFHGFINRFGSLLRDKLTKYERMALENINKEIESGLPSGFLTIEDLWNKKYEILKKAGNRSNIGVLGQYLHDNYLQRQLQENLRYAAENGQTRMRYPTSETAAKIEGYEKKTVTNPKILDEYRALDLERMLLYNEERGLGIFDRRRVVIEKRLAEIELREQELNSMLEFSPEHQTILKKYADFPKLFLKLFKDLQVRTVTDAKGNTWYEVDVPENYLNMEWLFKKGGLLISRNVIARFKNENN